MMGWIEGARLELPAGFEGRFGLVEMKDVRVDESPLEMQTEIEAFCNDLLEQGAATPEEWKQAVRGLLKQTGFKPSGRSKPSSEYQMQSLHSTGEFKFINTLVDMNNRISLESYLPISVLDVDAFRGNLVIRVGRPGERFVFNPAGQEIDLKNLIVACDDGHPVEHEGESLPKPLGNPIKDSMDGKLRENETTHAVGILYAPLKVDNARMQRYLDLWGKMATQFAAATEIHTRQLVTGDA